MIDSNDYRARVVEALVRIVKAADDSTIRAIAWGDSYAYPRESFKSYQALRAVIDTLDCRLDRQKDNHWHPREPVELVSYGAGEHSVEETAVALALLMISDLEGGNMDYISYRWQQTPGRDWFENLPATFRTPLMSGIDLLKSEWL